MYFDKVLFSIGKKDQINYFSTISVDDRRNKQHYHELVLRFE